MSQEEISLLIAFTAGVFTFFSPCILPLIPAYISFITGCSVSELSETKGLIMKGPLMRRILIETLLFIFGFSLVFIALGASATYIGNFISYNKRVVEIIGGLLVIFFGLHITGFFKIKYLDFERRFHLTSKPTTLFGSLIVGVTFAIGWTPCVGPILGGILTYAAVQDTVYHGTLLLSVYSLGLGIPFCVTGLCIGAFFGFFQSLRQHTRKISIISGLLLIGVGVLIMTNNFKFFGTLFLR